MPEGSKLATGWLELTVSTAGAQQAITNEVVPAAETAGISAGKKMGGGLLAGIEGIAGPLLAVAGLTAVFKTGFDEAKDAATNTAQLAAGLKSTGGAAGTTVKGMTDLAASIQGYSGQTDDSITKTESLLLTFQNIKNVGTDKVFDKTTKAAADMAARLGGDASSNARLLGKALNDPTQGLSALTRVGVQFTAGQKKQIQGYVQSGNLLKAQGVILDQVNSKFGGSAKAFGDTFPGQLAKLKRSFEDVSQSIVEAFIPILDSVVPAITSAFKLIGPVIGGIAGFLKPIAPMLAIIAGSILAVVAAMKIWNVIQTVWKTITAIGTGEQLAFNAALIANPIGLIIAGIVALVAGLIWFFTQTKLGKAIWADLVSFFTTTINGIVVVWNAVWSGISSFFVGIWNGIVGFARAYITLVLSIITGVGKTISSIWTGMWNGISTFFTNIWTGIVNGVKKGISTITGFFKSIPGTIGGFFSGAITWLVDAGKNIIQGLLNGAGKLLKGIGDFFLSILPGWIVAPFKAALGIHSPSTVFEEFGSYTMQGYVKGVTGQKSTVNSTIAGIVSPPQVSTAASTLAAAGVGGSGMTLVQNLHGIEDPDQFATASFRRFQQQQNALGA